MSFKEIILKDIFEAISQILIINQRNKQHFPYIFPAS